MRHLPLWLLLSCACTQSPADPSLLSLEPRSAHSGQRVMLQIFGQHLNPTVALNLDDPARSQVDTLFQVRLGDRMLTDARLVAANELRAELAPGLAPGTYDLRVTAPDGRVAVLQGAFQIVSPPDAGQERGSADGKPKFDASGAQEGGPEDGARDASAELALRDGSGDHRGDAPLRDGAGPDARSDGPRLDTPPTSDQRASDGGCPAACTRGCTADGTCRLDCRTGCSCPAGERCSISCGADGCSGTLDCRDATRCELTCTADKCKGTLTCPASGDCIVHTSRQGTWLGGLICGAGRCEVTCEDPQRCLGSVDCSASCACSVGLIGGSLKCPTSCPGGCGLAGGCDNC